MYKWVILHQEGDLRGYGDASTPRPSHFLNVWPWPEGASEVSELQLEERLDHITGEAFVVPVMKKVKASKKTRRKAVKKNNRS